jgi:hypothetical protein
MKELKKTYNKSSGYDVMTIVVRESPASLSILSSSNKQLEWLFLFLVGAGFQLTG